MKEASKNAPLALPSERSLIFLTGAIQFVNILDFMMVMPLGPDFARALNIPPSQIGLIGGAYTFAASISGLIAALFLDQFSRKRALLFFLLGLMSATFAGALVWDKASMLAVRLLAGTFGGPVTALALALIADYIPPQRRGAAIGKVMGGFAIASIVGVPFGLELAGRISWQAPFVSTGIVGVGIAVMAYFKLPYHPPFDNTKTMRQRARHLLSMLTWPLAQLSYAIMGLSMMAGFMIIPNIAAHVQMNLGYPRDQLGLLYFCGGAISFFSMRLAGKLADITSATMTATLFTTLLVITLLLGYICFPSPVPVLVLFVFFMVAMSGRNICAQTLSSKIPAPHQRGAFMSVQSAVSMLSSAAGAYYSSLILTEDGGKLLHMPEVGWSSLTFSLIVPVLFWTLERKIKRTGAAIH
jgi:predicted MFS family arabinose efflux permease